MAGYRPFEYQGIYELKGPDGRVDTMHLEDLAYGRLGVRQVTYVNGNAAGEQLQLSKLLRSGTNSQKAELEEYMKDMIGLLARHWEVVDRERSRDA